MFRLYTVIVDEDTHFGIINKNTFDTYLREISLNEHFKDQKFLLTSKVFLNVNSFIFKRSYYDLFKKFKIRKNDMLVEEYVDTEYMYFLKSGEYEISIKMNLLQLNDLLKTMGFCYVIDTDLPECK